MREEAQGAATIRERTAPLAVSAVSLLGLLYGWHWARVECGAPNCGHCYHSRVVEGGSLQSSICPACHALNIWPPPSQRRQPPNAGAPVTRRWFWLPAGLRPVSSSARLGPWGR